MGGVCVPVCHICVFVPVRVWLSVGFMSVSVCVSVSVQERESVVRRSVCLSITYAHVCACAGVAECGVCMSVHVCVHVSVCEPPLVRTEPHVPGAASSLVGS